MPRQKKGMGFLDDLKSFGISAAKDIGRELAPVAKEYAVSAVKSALTKKAEPASSGKGLYAKGTGFKLSAAQARALGVGKGVTLKPGMEGGEYEFKMTPAVQKKLARAFAKGKGMRMGAHNVEEVTKGGFIVPMLMTAARIAAPIIVEKLADAGIKKLTGSGKMGRGDPSMDTPKQAQTRAALKGMKALMGKGLFAGGGMPSPDGVQSEVTQTGSPYQMSGSPAMSPFTPSHNPFGYYAPL